MHQSEQRITAAFRQEFDLHRQPAVHTALPPNESDTVFMDVFTSSPEKEEARRPRNFRRDVTTRSDLYFAGPSPVSSPIMLTAPMSVHQFSDRNGCTPVSYKFCDAGACDSDSD